MDNLKDKFELYGYVHDQSVFYVQPIDDEGKEIVVMNTIWSSWDPLWVQQNKEFERKCKANPTFEYLRDKM